MASFRPIERGRELIRPPPVLIVVDDDTAVRNSLKFAFEVEGFTVSVYATAGELLAEPGLPASGCLLVDYYLPDLNGLELLAKLRGRGVTLPAVVITGHPSLAVRRRVAEAGFRFVEKPLLGDNLVDMIREVL